MAMDIRIPLLWDGNRVDVGVAMTTGGPWGACRAGEGLRVAMDIRT